MTTPGSPRRARRTASRCPPSLAGERAHLEALQATWHHRRYLAPDPLEFVPRSGSTRDREVIALVASGLAYGNVTAMRPAIARVLSALGPSPAARIADDRPAVRRALASFRYRVTPGAQLAGMLRGAAAVQRAHGTLGKLVATATADAERAGDAEPILAAAGALVTAMRDGAGTDLRHLLPHPDDGSACKRLFLMFRWLVRRDEIDPGGWHGVPPRLLVMPLDTHVRQYAAARRWTARRTASLAAALEITAYLRRICPDDPLRYDFAITRPGIRGA